MQHQGLGKSLNALEEALEDHPDAWFNSPKGYLSKPDFKRDQQTKSYIASGKEMVCIYLLFSLITLSFTTQSLFTSLKIYLDTSIFIEILKLTINYSIMITVFLEYIFSFW
jgi:hypothetical protein